jgi:hypothetical protein
MAHRNASAELNGPGEQAQVEDGSFQQTHSRNGIANLCI